MMNNSGKLSSPYPMTTVEEAKSTKERILIESTMLFARHGYSAVSMRDIAKKMGMTVAALYNHFDGKEQLWNAVLDNVQTLYLLYFKRLEAATENARNFRELLGFMFVELHQVVNIFTYYAFSLVMAEQFKDERANEIYRELFLSYSIGFIKGRFDDAIAQGMCRQFNTQFAAAQFMHSVLFGICQRTHADMGHRPAYDTSQMFRDLECEIYILATGTRL